MELYQQVGMPAGLFDRYHRRVDKVIESAYIDRVMKPVPTIHAVDTTWQCTDPAENIRGTR